MNKPSEKYVYHGSRTLFESVVPKRQRRYGKSKNDGMEIIFDEVSFHVTSHKWIALAYMCNHKSLTIKGKRTHYTMGVDLYTYKEEIEIYGINSLEDSLDEMYKEGGHLFTFKKEDFTHMEGLGNFELITKKSPKPVRVERINNPVSELKKLDISFKYIDLEIPENLKNLGF